MYSPWYTSYVYGKTIHAMGDATLFYFAKKDGPVNTVASGATHYL